MPLRLGPFDEVRHDEEVAGELHRRDHVELEVEPLDVFVFRAAFHQSTRGEALRKSLMRLLPQFLRLITVRKARQDGSPRLHPVGAAHGDLDRVLDRLGKVGKQCGHLGLRLEIVLGRQPPPVLGDENLALGDADQRVMGGIVLGLCKVSLVGGDQRNFEAVGKVDQPLLGLALGRQSMALEFDIEAVSEYGLEALKLLGGERPLPRQQRVVDGTGGTAREADQPARVFRQIVPLDVMLGIVGRREIGPAGEFHQVAVAFLVLGEESERRDAAKAACVLEAALLLFRKVDLQRAADDGLDALFGHGVGKFERAKEIAGVGDRHCRHPGHFRHLRERLDLQGALGQRIGRVRAQVHEGDACVDQFRHERIIALALHRYTSGGSSCTGTVWAPSYDARNIARLSGRCSVRYPPS